MKDTASQVIVFSAFALLGGSLSLWNNPRPMGEFGHFGYAFSRVTVCFGVWGLATGIGLWRKWRWARISMLVFGGILVTRGALLPAVMMLPVGRRLRMDVEVHNPQGCGAGSSPYSARRGSPLVEILHAHRFEVLFSRGYDLNC